MANAFADSGSTMSFAGLRATMSFAASARRAEGIFARALFMGCFASMTDASSVASIIIQAAVMAPAGVMVRGPRALAPVMLPVLAACGARG